MDYNLRTSKTWAQTLDDIAETMDKWRVSKWKVECLLTPRRATNEYQSPTERTVTLRYTKAGSEVVLSMNKQPRAVDNLRVFYLAVEAMRMNDRRAASAMCSSRPMPSSRRRKRRRPPLCCPIPTPCLASAEMPTWR